MQTNVSRPKALALIVTMALKDVPPRGARVETEATALSVFRYLVHLLRNFAMTDPELADSCEIRGLQVNGSTTARVDVTSPYSASMPLFSKSQWHHDIARAIAEQAPRLVGFNAYVWNVEDLLRISHFLRSMQKDVVIIFGGPECYGLVESRRMLGYHQHIDAIVRGEGELAFRDLLRFYLLDKGSLDEVPFLTYRRGTTVVESSSSVMLDDLDDIPSAILSQLPADIVRGNVVFPHISMAISRGCPIGCRFCMYSVGLTESTRVRAHSKERVIQELAFLRDVGVCGIDFLDATFAAQKDLVVHVLRYFLEEYVTCQIAFEQKLDAMHGSVLELVEALMRKGRIAFLDVGLQSTNEQALKIMSRRNNLDKLGQNLRRSSAAGTSSANVPILIDLMAGLPGDDFAGFLRSVDYVANHLRVEVCPSAKFMCAPLAVIPGTSFRNDAEELGLIYEPTPPYTVFASKTNSVEDVRRAKSVIHSLFVLDPALERLHELGVSTEGLLEELFTSEHFARVEALGWDKPLSHLFAVTERLRDVLGARLDGDPRREAVLERLDYVYAMRLRADFKDVSAELLQLPSLVSSPLVPEESPLVSEDTRLEESFRPVSPIDSTHVFRFAHGRELGLLAGAGRADEPPGGLRFGLDFSDEAVQSSVVYLAILEGRALAFSEWTFGLLQRLYSGEPEAPAIVPSRQRRAALRAFAKSGLLRRGSSLR